MLYDTLSVTRDLPRLHEIGSVLVRHGLGDLVRRLGLVPLLQRAGRTLHWQGAQGLDREPVVHLREALEELGPTFVKLGQILAGRPDFLPPAWIRELSLLHEGARHVSFGELSLQLEQDWGAAPGVLFRELDEEPLAAASIAQVHRATLLDGTPVVLKVRRPNVERTVAADMRLLARIAERAEERMPELRRYRPRRFVRALARSLRAELDLRVEARNSERLRASLPADGRIVVPRIHSQWTRERVLVMDYLEGPSVGEWARAGRPGAIDGAALAARGADAILKMVFVDGCYHADPHPGNVILLADGRVGLIDFGMVGVLTEERRLEFLDLLLAVSARRVDDAVEVLLGWSEGAADVDLLTQDCTAFIDRYYGASLRDLDTSVMLADLFGLLRENELSLPSEVAMLLKLFLTLDGLGLLVDPDFVMAKHVEPFAEAAVRARHSPAALTRRGARELGGFLRHLPRDMRAILARARRGHLPIELDLPGLEAFGRKLDRGTNRLSMALVTAALIVGTSIAMTVAGGPTILGVPALGLVGFLTSVVAGLWLLASILRSG